MKRKKHTEDPITKLVSLIKDSKKVYVFTGAGISTDSGIPDFRSPGGFWDRVDPMKTSTATVLYNNPSLFYQSNIPRYKSILSAEPNDGHKALAWMEEQKYINGVITQNIDGLHQKAGSKHVIEIHGSVNFCRCENCSEKKPMNELIEQVDKSIIPPRCSSCGFSLRPNIVLFEDAMDDEYYKAQQVLTGCDLMIIIGSSLQVYPAAYLPDKVKHLAIINRTETQWDPHAKVILNCEITSKLKEIKEKLQQV
ncbi:SIR2 family NAD-dependent protein deacylase [Desulfitibacter alkalitolerans]|uniref:SIR2 family NAD-dependent protein deacylase n=1 Tax=Desulfitibacter alkalitolerans TaxID=264641 RepID=UPI0006844392|nr:NAD-dependent deacylase [Desulfitibacter alkalitolerans]